MIKSELEYKVTLRQWVRNSDIILMVTANAKHVATGFIQENRPSHMAPILLINSKVAQVCYGYLKST